MDDLTRGLKRILFALAAASFVACGDDDDDTTPDAGPSDAGRDTGTADTGVDTGTPDADGMPEGGGGTDGGSTDATTGDAGGDGGMMMMANAFVRAGHFIPNGPPVRICAQLLVGSMTVGPTGNPLPPPGSPGLMYRAVSGYLPFPARLPTGAMAGYRIRVFSAEALDSFLGSGGGMCPMEGAAGAPAPIIQQDVPAGTLEAGSFYSVVAVGFANDSDGSRPEFCGPTFSMTCPDEERLRPHLTLMRDDHGGPASGRVRVRFFNAVANSPAPMSICHDPDGPTMPMMPSAVASAVAYDAADRTYADIDPITTGFLGLYVPSMAAGPCSLLVGGLPIPAPDPIGTSMFPGTSKTLEAGRTLTVFAIGRIDPAAAGMTSPPTHIPTFIPVIDAPPMAAP
ncbi:MAG: DUF4397 domain-containing protein [Myxococcota bacterium]|nr:DUF4397 domain-containing protein [Myxococcota bacterium]MDW8360844.1 hypothetical protein [Myxococcales bacterium]